MLNFELNTLTIIALALISAGLFLQLFYWWGLFARLAFFKDKAPQHEVQQPVSVVICARNEYHNLKNNLPLILNQAYPEFEVVVVNDCSEDESEEYLDDMARAHSNLKVVRLRQSLNFFRGKKFPLSVGIKSAKHNTLLLTDADCRPESELWIAKIAAAYGDGTEVVLGYGGYERKPGLLNKLIRFDTLQIGMQYLSLALAGKPYMGVGRNLSYLKEVFIQNKGFTSHYNIPSGDDDLFISQVANKYNTRIVVAEGARTLSKPKENFLAWIGQKRRHLTTGVYYSTGSKIILGLYSIGLMLFIAGFVWLLLLPFSFFVPLGLLLLRVSTQLFVTRACMKRLGEKELLLFSPIAELLIILTNIALGLLNLVKKPGKWK